MSEQKRADAWLLMRWIQNLYIENIIIENVKEFQNWGPLGANGRPLKSKRGEYFRQFIEFLKTTYSVDYRILNAADYGDATSRERLFVIARRPAHKPVVWPVQTHASRKVLDKAKEQPSLFVNSLKPWRSAREIIDWDLEGKSIFNRKKPLSENTMRRIFAGLFKYGLRNFLVNNKGSNRADRSVEEPTYAQTGANHQFLAEPFLLNMKGKDGQFRDMDDPAFTQTTKDHQSLVKPFLVNYKGMSNARDIEDPTFTQTKEFHQYVAVPELVKLLKPFLLNISHTSGKDSSYVYSDEEPVKTILGKAHHAVADPEVIGTVNEEDLEPYLIKYYTGSDAKDIDDPVGTITGNYEHFGVIRPYLLNFRKGQGAEDIEEPTKTLTTKSSYGLCIPQIGAVLDIKFRMLQPHELKKAMGFPETYSFAGNRGQKVKQIGNAVPVNLAKALVRSLELQPYKK